MILRRGQVPADPGSEDRAARFGAFESLRYSDAGGLTQYGAHVETLHPGSRSSDRHWHEEEDEFLYMLAGVATVVEDDGVYELGPGDAACWPAGVANAHHVVNHSDAPCTYLIVGTRSLRDVVRYPDLGRVLINDGPRWRLLASDGTLIREGQA